MFFTFALRVAFRVVLIFEQQQGCNFKFRTNREIWDHHLELSLWTNQTWLAGVV